MDVQYMFIDFCAGTREDNLGEMKGEALTSPVHTVSQPSHTVMNISGLHR